MVAAPAAAAVYAAPLRTVVRQLPVAVESIVGTTAPPGATAPTPMGTANTRAEVLQQETRAAIVYTSCTVETGRWLS